MATCGNCGVGIQDGQEALLRGKGKQAATAAICSNCASDLESALRAETENPNLLVALLLGLLAALGSSLIWYGLVAVTGYQLGIIAIGVGWLVAQAVVIGAGRKRGLKVQAISIVAVVIAMALGEYLLVRHYAIQALEIQGLTDIPVLLPIDVMLELIVAGIESDMLTLVFWGIAVYEAFTIPAQRKLQILKPWEASLGQTSQVS